MMRNRQHFLTKTLPVLLILCFFATIFTAEKASAQETKWIKVGSLHNWYMAIGCEPETARRGLVSDQQDGLRWPAEYRDQDMQAAKGMWIGARNYSDLVGGVVYPHKVVHSGPRHWDEANETMPVEFRMIGRFEHPTVIVDGNISSTLQFDDILDDVDPNQKADRVIINRVQTSMGVEFTRTIYAFSQQYHDNYFIYEYKFKNNGVVDLNGTTNPQTIEDMWVLWQYRYAVSKEMGAYGKNFMPQSATWGENTVNDARGEDPAFGDPFRAQFSWHGRHSRATDSDGQVFDNIGAPDYRTTGRLAAPQYVGVVTIHADVSASDKSDDILQPKTTWYQDSDGTFNQANFNNQYNPNNMTTEYGIMTAGHPPIRHADLVGDDFADLKDPGAGGLSQTQGFGGYTLAAGDSVTIVMAEAAAGISWEKRIEVGLNWVNNSGPFVLPNGGTTTDRDEYKDAWVYTGEDSIFQTFNRAIANWNSSFDITLPPPPPDIFEVASGGDRIQLTWSNNAESHPGFAGYKIFRALGQPDTTYEMIAELPAGTGQFDDVTAARGFDYYYYIVSYDDGTNNNGGINPAGSLQSSRFYTQTNDPARLRSPAGTALDAVRVVPNPYNVRAALSLELGYGSERIAFLDVPAECIIKIFTERGDLIREIEHTDGSGDEFWDLVTSSRQIVVSGIYIAYIEVTNDYYNPEDPSQLLYRKGDNITRKFVIIR